MKHHGFSIALEGGEGTGKSTVGRWLQTQIADSILVREPGQTEYGKTVRAWLLDGSQHWTPAQQAELFTLDRMLTAKEITIPALRRGTTVLTDRSFYSTLAYQHSRENGTIDGPRMQEYLHRLQRIGVPVPDLVLLFDLDPQIGLHRRFAEGEVNQIDAMSLEFHQQVRNAFRELAEYFRHQFVIIDASQPLERVQADAIRHIRERMHERR